MVSTLPGMGLLVVEPPSVNEIDEIQRRALNDLKLARLDELERWRIKYLGRSGEITAILRGLSLLPSELRRSVGAAANKSKRLLEERLKNHKEVLEKGRLAAGISQDSVDVTLSGWPMPLGGLHPTTRMVRDMCSIFVGMGFDIAEGPEVELGHYNFDMLNIPKFHPARDMWDTLWIEKEDENGERPLLLRTHTSPMQARIMEKMRPPIRVVVPGKCYRYEATDATHEWQLFQIEGLVVDEGVTFAELKGTIYEFAKQMFGDERQVRFRCDYFPFVEPGVDVSIDCFKCDGKGCRICSDTGWIEIAGAGMVHPRVLEGVGYDKNCYTGFAFGFGVERVAMLKYGIEDIRLFYSNDVRFLRQF